MQHLRQCHATQGIAHHIVDQAPVGAHTALVGDPALTVVLAAFGDGQRSFHGFDDLHQGDRAGRTCKPVAAMHAAQSFHQASLRQRLEDLADGGCFQAGLFGQFARAEHLVAPCSQHRQDDGGVIGQFGDAQHARTVNP